jgi:hypothetical protein
VEIREVHSGDYEVRGADWISGVVFHGLFVVEVSQRTEAEKMNCGCWVRLVGRKEKGRRVTPPLPYKFYFPKLVPTILTVTTLRPGSLTSSSPAPPLFVLPG